MMDALSKYLFSIYFQNKPFSHNSISNLKIRIQSLRTMMKLDPRVYPTRLAFERVAIDFRPFIAGGVPFVHS